jgi:hypothetical protein
MDKDTISRCLLDCHAELAFLADSIDEGVSLDDDGTHGFSLILKDIAAKLLDVEEALGDGEK